MNEFKRVERKSNWSYWDELNGKPLEHGELVEVQYPDGTIERGIVETTNVEIPIQDMGHIYYGRDTMAFIYFDFHGANVKLGLRGMMARRV